MKGKTKMQAAIIVINLILSVFILAYIHHNKGNKEKMFAYYDDGSPPKYFITGDKHRNFQNIKNF